MKQSKKKARKAAAPKGPPPRVSPSLEELREQFETTRGPFYSHRMMRPKP